MGWAVFVHAQPSPAQTIQSDVGCGWPGRVGEERDTRAPRLSLFFLAWALFLFNIKIK